MIQIHATRKLFEILPLTRDGQFAVTKRSQWLFERTALDINPLAAGMAMSLLCSGTILCCWCTMQRAFL